MGLWLGLWGGCCTMHEGEVLAGGNRCEVGVQFLPLLKKRKEKSSVYKGIINSSMFNCGGYWRSEGFLRPSIE